VGTQGGQQIGEVGGAAHRAAQGIASRSRPAAGQAGALVAAVVWVVAEAGDKACEVAFEQLAQDEQPRTATQISADERADCGAPPSLP
jgi:hypothetical protein